MKAQILYTPDEVDRNRLRARLDPTISLRTGRPVQTDTQLLIGGRPRPVDLTTPDELWGLVIPYAGLPVGTRRLLMADFPTLPVYNLHHNAPPVAEMALALLLGVTRYLIPMHRKLRAFDWRARYAPDPAFTLQGKTVLILGHGAIGRRLTAPLRALGASVIATRRRVAAPVDVDGATIYPAAALDTLLPQAQAVIVAVPHTEETDGLLDARRLSLLPRGAALVNIARASVIDEDALYEALRSGQLCGAGLDVWYRYPRGVPGIADTPPCDRPLWELDNVLFSPHRAGHVQDTEALRMDALADTLNALAHGKSPEGQVDVAAGY
ncbi:MAG: NAD(P)-dependent oxidoreductase [Myxococcota bacterium]